MLLEVKSSGRSNSPDNTSSWAEKLLEAHERSEEHLQFLEKELSQPSTERCGTKSPQPKFKYKRNKIQYELNEKVLDTLVVAASASDEKARNGALEEGKKILKESNKHILLAEKYWREQAIRIFTYMYLDDGAGAGKSLDTARAA